MGVIVREKVHGSNIWWVFLHYKGMRASHRVGSENAAIEFKEELESRLNLGLDVFKKPEPKEAEPEKQLTLREYYGTFQDTYLKTSCRESTQERYYGCFDDYILPRFGDIPLDEIRRGAGGCVVA